jgi:hypothetical protein
MMGSGELVACQTKNPRFHWSNDSPKNTRMVCGRRKIVNKQKTWGSAEIPLTPCNHLVPEARVELARPQGSLDFESSASTSFTTPAFSWGDYSEVRFKVSTSFRMTQSAQRKHCAANPRALLAQSFPSPPRAAPARSEEPQFDHTGS